MIPSDLLIRLIIAFVVIVVALVVAELCQPGAAENLTKWGRK